MKKTSVLITIIIALLSGYIISAGFRFGSPDKEEKGTPENRNNPPGKDKEGSIVLLNPYPEYLEFAGEAIPLDEPDLIERYDKEIIVNTHFHSSTILLIKKSNRWLPLIEKVLKDHGIPEDFKYLSLIESGLENARSYRGAVGFWQLLASTARELGLEVNAEVDERYSPIKSTEAACKYILKAREKFGTWTNAAASYNIGMRGLSRNMERQKADSYYDLLLNDETSRYIFRVIAIKHIFENPEKYGFFIPEEQLYTFEPLDSVEVTESVSDLAEFAISQGINYKALKRHNPWLRKNTLTIKSRNKSYIVTIPRSTEKKGNQAISAADSLITEPEMIESRNSE